MSNYEGIKPADIRVGDVLFTAGQEREVLAVEYREKYAAPGLTVERPAYLVTLERFAGQKMYRPNASVTRKVVTPKDSEGS